MQQAFLSMLALVTLALAGCSGGSDHQGLDDVACPDGTLVKGSDLEDLDGHHDADFDATEACPTPPQVTLSGLPATLQVYGTSSFNWTVDPGSVAHGHSMLTAIRYSMTSVPDASASLDNYSKEAVKKEHQDLPVALRGNLTFNVPGMIYLRAYAQVQGDGYERRDVWSPEVALEILPVQPTGVTHTVTHAMGPLGELDPNSLTIDLGDAVVFENADLVEHTLTADGGPAGSVACSMTAAGNNGVSDPCIFVVPGSYSYTSDDVQSKRLTVNVRLPS